MSLGQPTVGGHGLASVSRTPTSPVSGMHEDLLPHRDGLDPSHSTVGWSDVETHDFPLGPGTSFETQRPEHGQSRDCGDKWIQGVIQWNRKSNQTRIVDSLFQSPSEYIFVITSLLRLK